MCPVGRAYGMSLISFLRMHRMKHYGIDGVKEVALKEPSRLEELEESR